MFEELLTKVGLTEKEVSVYLEVVRRGKTTPAMVAKATGINRATVYSVSKALLEKGVVAGDLGGRSMYLTALPPEHLRLLVEREQKIVQRKSAAVERVVRELKAITQETEYSVPKIRLIEEAALEEFLYKNIDKWNRSALQHDGTHWGFQDHTYVNRFEKWVDEFWKRSPQGIKVRLLSNSSDTERKMREKSYRDRVVHYWKEGSSFTASTWVIGDYLVLISTRQRPFYLIELFNPAITANMRELFRSIWQSMNETRP